MLTRLHVKGFKNLVDTEVRFGPVTCIAGLNGVGKSNIFDAIHFLSLLADRPFVEAAKAIRGGANLFTVGGAKRMHLECDLLIEPEGLDDFGQPASASHTFLNYQLELALDHDAQLGLPKIRLCSEQLSYITKGSASKRLGFDPSAAWLQAVLSRSSRRTDFISTEASRHTVVRLHQDKMRDQSRSRRGGGRPSDFPADRLPRTVLSSAQNAEETRTAVLVRQEMRKWRLLQLEPSALRRPDDLNDPKRIDASGAHVPATLYRLANGDNARVYAEVANRLSQLVDGVADVRVDHDQVRQVLSFKMRDRHGLELPASSLSDGTLRFVALAVLAQDPDATGVLCLEEPENGIHPERIEAILRLLEDMAVDVENPAGVDNPLRQVIFSTHSPVVAAHVLESDLVWARLRPVEVAASVLQSLEIVAMPRSWRAPAETLGISRGRLLGYLGSIAPKDVLPRSGKRVGEQLGLVFSPPAGS